MAAPIAHIFLALQMLAGPLQNLYDEKEFVLGTSFPDIRYMGVISREQTHAENVTLEQIKQERDSFKAGMLFHAYVDEQREKYIVDHQIYQQLPNIHFKTQTLKFAEDLLLRPIVADKNYAAYFQTIVSPPLFNMSPEKIQQWYTHLHNYCQPDFNIDSAVDAYLAPKPLIKRWYYKLYYKTRVKPTLKKILNNHNIKQNLLAFYLAFAQKQSKSITG